MVKAQNVLEISGSTTLTYRFNILLVDASGGSITLTLPAAYGGMEFKIRKTDSSSNNVTIVSGVGQLINGQASVILTSVLKSVQLCCNETAWYTLLLPVMATGPTGMTGTNGTVGPTGPTGASAERVGSLLYWNSGTSPGNNRFLVYDGSENTEGKTQIVITRSGILSNLTARWANTSTSTCTGSIRINGSDTNLATALSNVTLQNQDSANQVSVSVYNLVSLMTRVSDSANAPIAFTVEFKPT